MTNRRKFLKGIAAVGAASGLGVSPRESDAAAREPERSAAVPPSSRVQSMEGESAPEYSESEAAYYFVRNPASDFMVDAIKSLGIRYVTSNPGSSFRGLHESIVNYGGNRQPEFLTCLHEESAVAMGHGYSKIAQEPLAVACHGTVGLQHASMAIYNAWCDRAPVIVLAGNHLDATHRRNFVEWAHSVQDASKLVRDFIKWDDTPVSLPHFAESLVRAYKIAMTPPMGPVVIVVDGDLQERELGDESPPIPALSSTVPPQGDQAALREAARALVDAERPVILADRAARTPVGMKRLVELAEALEAPVVDRLGRLNFPTDHYLNHTGRYGRLVAEADVILGLELFDFWGSVHRVRDLVHREKTRVARNDVELISLGVNDLFMKSNYQSFQRYQPVDLAIGGDAEATLPALTEEVKRAMSAERRARIAERGSELETAYREMRAKARKDATYAWNASPVSTARLAMELWQQIKDRDWSLVSRTSAVSHWPQRLWTMNQHHHFIGTSGGFGVGYGAPASVGAALANRAHGRLTVSFQSDGDLMYGPGVLWTAAHHGIPLLSVMHNNRGYHQELMHLQRMANRRRRGADGSAKIGNAFEDPFIDYAELARSMGIWAEGPVSDPEELAPILARAVEVVERGEPALVDVVSQPR